MMKFRGEGVRRVRAGVKRLSEVSYKTKKRKKRNRNRKERNKEEKKRNDERNKKDESGEDETTKHTKWKNSIHLCVRYNLAGVRLESALLPRLPLCSQLSLNHPGKF